ncbi:hypothetical protein [Kordiimonas sp.]|uniref:hypothetical protein n=1 Tax=Kordiimonas sp. TaxID=1970157 RepID=UPI003A8D6353
MPTPLTYQAALDDIFTSYMQAKPQHKGKFDREFRNPAILVSLAENLGLLPQAPQTIRITGSKGKGTTSRLTARYLTALSSESSVGLMVSPEDLDHTDRMQVNGAEISKTEFSSIYTALQPDLHAALARLPEGGYLSPSGLFMLVALAWFKQRQVDFYVLETGRGALFDEVGQIPSAVSVVTSIFLEHPANLGPGLDDIARDKLSIAQTSGTLVCPPEVMAAYPALVGANCTPLAKPAQFPDHPGWFSRNEQLARTAASVFLDRTVSRKASAQINLSSPSFGWIRYRNCTICYEAIINTMSADTALYENKLLGAKTVVLASLPDDKDRKNLLATFKAFSPRVYEVALSGTRGYLNYAETAEGNNLVATFAFGDITAMRDLLDSIIEREAPETLYIAGTQTYVRLFKLAMGDLYSR